MKREDLIKKLNQFGCELVRHGENTMVCECRQRVATPAARQWGTFPFRTLIHRRTASRKGAKNAKTMPESRKSSRDRSWGRSRGLWNARWPSGRKTSFSLPGKIPREKCHSANGSCLLTLDVNDARRYYNAMIASFKDLDTETLAGGTRVRRFDESSKR